MYKLNQSYIKTVVKRALDEDLKPRGDITTNLIKYKNKKVKAKIFAKQDLIDQDLNLAIHIEGFLPDEKLLAYYRHAKILVYPSLYEGFGLPPLEAMASLTPVIAENNSSLPEGIGEAGLLLDKLSPKSLTQAVKTLLQDKNLYKDLIVDTFRCNVFPVSFFLEIDCMKNWIADLSIFTIFKLQSYLFKNSEKFFRSFL